MAAKRGRGRPAGAKNKPGNKKRGAKVPSATGSVSTDHNRRDNVIPFQSQELTDEQQKTMFFRHRRKYELALAAKKSADANLKNVAKQAKGDGVNVDAIKLSLTDTDVLEAKVRAEVTMMQQVGRWLALPIGTQLSLLDEVDRSTGEERAFRAGEVAGLEGKGRDDGPYAPHLPQANEWRKGWDKGQDLLRQKFTLKDERTEAKPPKKGKPEAEPESPVAANGQSQDDQGEGDDGNDDSPYGEAADAVDADGEYIGGAA